MILDGHQKIENQMIKSMNVRKDAIADKWEKQIRKNYLKY
jgi:hypothetical protein